VCVVLFLIFMVDFEIIYNLDFEVIVSLRIKWLVKFTRNLFRPPHSIVR